MSSSDVLGPAARRRLRAVELNAAGRPAAAARALRGTVRMLDGQPAAPAAADLRARVLATLAHSEAELGRVDLAQSLLATAMDTPGAGPEATGILFNQRGLLLLRQGRLAASVADFDRAVESLAGWPDSRCVVLLNRSAAYLYQGDVRRAADDLELCAAVAAERANVIVAAKARHNLGYLALLRRDLPAALRELAAAHAALTVLAPGYCGIVRLDRARALRDAGLLDEADAELAAAVEVLREHRLDQDLGEAQLVRAEVAVLAGRLGPAREYALAARRRFRRRHNDTWALLADLVLLQVARPATAAAAARRLPGARAVAAGLRAAGLTDEARSAALVADGIELIAGGDPDIAPVRRGDRVGLRLQTRLVRFEAARLRGDEQAARRELRRGLTDVHRHRGAVGSHDLRAGAAAHGGRLIDGAIRDALRDGRPAVVHAWVERARAVSLRMAPVRPPADPQLAAELAELRALHAAQRAAALDGRPADAARLERRAGLERTVRQRSWELAGGREQDHVTPLGEVRATLAPVHGALVSYVAAGGDLAAVVATAGRARLVPLGSAGPLAELVPRLRADLDMIARGTLPVLMRGAVEASAAAGLRALDEALWSPLARRTGTGPVVIVPTGVLSAVPWTALPGLRGRPLTVAPSATWWSAAPRHRTGSGPVGVAAGPRLTRAAHECRSVAASWPAATVLTGQDARAQAVLDLAGRSAVLHLAAHGRHESQNPLFSWVDLADGPIFGHDLPRLHRPPAHVVLSACDVGLAVVRPGDEPLGMTAAFLQAGTTSVVASTAQVGDEAACEVMSGYHALLAAGRSPAEALALAGTAAARGSAAVPLPFVGFGAAW